VLRRRRTVRVSKSSHSLVHTGVLLELVHWDSVLHAIHRLSISQAEGIPVDSVDEFHRVDEFEAVNKTAKGLFAKPSIRVNLFIVLEHVFVVVQSLDNCIKEIIHSNLLHVTVLRRSEAHALQSSQSSTTIKSSTTRHRRDNLSKVNGLSNWHSHQLREHRRIHPSSSSEPSKHLLHVASLTRCTVLLHSLWHHGSVGFTVCLTRNWGYSSAHVTRMATPSPLNSCTWSITTHQVSPCRVSSQHESILVIRSRTAVTRHLPRFRTSSSHHVHAIVQLIHCRVLAADVVLPVPVEYAPRHLPTPLRHLPLTSILIIAFVLVEASALVVRLGHEASTAADCVSNLPFHHRNIVAVRVTVLR